MIRTNVKTMNEVRRTLRQLGTGGDGGGGGGGGGGESGGMRWNVKATDARLVRPSFGDLIVLTREGTQTVYLPRVLPAAKGLMVAVKLAAQNGQHWITVTSRSGNRIDGWTESTPLLMCFPYYWYIFANDGDRTWWIISMFSINNCTT